MRRILPVLLLALLAACGDGADAVTAAPASAPASPSSSTPVDACVELDVAVLDQVEDPGPADTRPEGSGPSPEEVARIEAAAAALGRLAEGGPEDLRADAGILLDVYDLALDDPDDVTDEMQAASDEAAQRLLDQGVERCEVPEPIWSCAHRGTFRYGASIEPGAPIEPDAEEAPAGDPAEAVGRGDIDPTWTRQEVVTTERRVTFAAGIGVRPDRIGQKN